MDEGDDSYRGHIAASENQESVLNATAAQSMAQQCDDVPRQLGDSPSLPQDAELPVSLAQSHNAAAVSPSQRSSESDGTVAELNRKNLAPAVKRKSDPRIFKIIVIGDSNVGKTCLTYRFCEGKFPSKVEATIGVDFREKTLEIGDESLKLQLWDTAGQERFRKSMVPHYYRNVHAVVYVYDVTKRSTFESLVNWLEEYGRYSLNADVPRILVGNKCDLSSDMVQVSTGEAQCFADEHRMPLFETSAKDDARMDHVESIFMTLAHKLKESKPMMGHRYSLNTGSKAKPVHIQYSTIGQEKDETCAC